MAQANKARHRTFKSRRNDDNVETRIGRGIEPQANGCWLWKGKANNYGVTMAYGGDPISVHRFVYETLVGPIPDDHHLHHECLTPGCCNPEHLTPLAPGDHMREHARLRRAG